MEAQSILIQFANVEYSDKDGLVFLLFLIFIIILLQFSNVEYSDKDGLVFFYFEG